MSAARSEVNLPAVALPDGAIVRGARGTDVPEMVALEADREGEDDAVDLQLVADTPGGLESMSVVELDGRIVSMATLLNETLTVGSTALPTGQVEMVATTRDAESRGYVRALMERSHSLSEARGHVLQVMIGIPNFYRQFGYAYSIPMHPWASVVPGIESPDGYSLKAATIESLDVLRALQEKAQTSFNVTMPHSDECWRWILSHTSSKQWVVRDSDDEPCGLARIYDDGEGYVDVGEVTTTSEAATQALLNHALDAAGPSGTVRVNLRPGVPGLIEQTKAAERAEWYYVRIADPATLLQAMAPELIARVRYGNLPAGEALISFFRRHVRIAWAEGVVTVVPGGPLQAPVSAGGSGIPMDALGSLLFGDGAASLEDRFPDALLGGQADLMRTLFPAQRADLLTFYLAS